MKYMNFDTGEIWTEQELKDRYNQIKDELTMSFDDMMDFLLSQGRERKGGLIEVDE